MLGAIIGDIAGSRFEWKNYKGKDFEFFHKDCEFTDDSVMTIAVAQALMDTAPKYNDLDKASVKRMQEIGHLYPDAGYGGHFQTWLMERQPKPYGSYGNGAPMRVSACGFMAKSLDEAKRLSYEVTKVSHNHPEGIKGAEATTVAVYMAWNGKSKEDIKKYIVKNYYKLDFTIDSIRPKYRYDISSQGSVPPAIEAFLEGKDFEDVIRNAISIGGDSDTIGAIAGGIAEAYFGIPAEMQKKAKTYLDDRLIKIVDDFYKKLPAKKSMSDNSFFGKIMSMFE